MRAGRKKPEQGGIIAEQDALQFPSLLRIHVRTISGIAPLLALRRLKRQTGQIYALAEFRQIVNLIVSASNFEDKNKLDLMWCAGGDVDEAKFIGENRILLWRRVVSDLLCGPLSFHDCDHTRDRHQCLRINPFLQHGLGVGVNCVDRVATQPYRRDDRRDGDRDRDGRQIQNLRYPRPMTGRSNGRGDRRRRGHGTTQRRRRIGECCKLRLRHVPHRAIGPIIRMVQFERPPAQGLPRAELLGPARVGQTDRGADLVTRTVTVQPSKTADALCRKTTRRSEEQMFREVAREKAPNRRSCSPSSRS